MEIAGYFVSGWFIVLSVAVILILATSIKRLTMAIPSLPC
mgnify:CR=1 FL=1